MNKETTAVVIWILLGITILMFNSCSVLIGYGGNPEPNMKSIHMAMNHPGYTIDDYNRHPDHDCNGSFKIEESNQNCNPF